MEIEKLTSQDSETKRDTIKHVEKTIELIEYLSLEVSDIGVREASRILDVSKSTMQRILNSLLEKQIVSFNEKTQNYSLDFGVLRLALPFFDKNILKTVSEKFLEELRDEVGETVGLHIHLNDKQIVVHQFESKNELRWSIPVGKSYPMNVGASGKALLAFMDAETFERAKQHFSIETQFSQIGETLIRELEYVREVGFSITREEISVGVMGIAVPIFQNNQVAASLSIYGPVARLGLLNIEELVDRLKEKSQLISEKLS
ncbi:IclR family transcriptional regulator [Peribacillus cavernae]|uniref:IclR family transcriptional regulator n=1 Tax=Peribacillus cavernae TaxID=1674310 RepID=A0A433H7E6_9BACI|nr:IclR family transcriptional regulator [Peribacillus cavernae]MDQ0218640.1 DNA-binding IclR family transcriptional regulator [Peribacillus cavernae]RUQ24234.1 IclR family transcriptional regulator [Peribacillus cavernae]